MRRWVSFRLSLSKRKNNGCLYHCSMGSVQRSHWVPYDSPYKHDSGRESLVRLQGTLGSCSRLQRLDLGFVSPFPVIFYVVSQLQGLDLTRNHITNSGAETLVWDLRARRFIQQHSKNRFSEESTRKPWIVIDMIDMNGMDWI